MARTWQDMLKVEERRKANAQATYLAALAREKARHEVLLQLVSGKLKAKQLQGPIWSGKAGSMGRAIRFNLQHVIELRAQQIMRESR